MENVAENTQAETQEEKAPEGMGKYAIYQDDGRLVFTEEGLQAMLQATAKAAIKELRKEEAKEKKKNKYHDTFSLMRCYRDATFHIKNAISEGAQLELEGMTEEQQEI